MEECTSQLQAMTDARVAFAEIGVLAARLEPLAEQWQKTAGFKLKYAGINDEGESREADEALAAKWAKAGADGLALVAELQDVARRGQELLERSRVLVRAERSQDF